MSNRYCVRYMLRRPQADLPIIKHIINDVPGADEAEAAANARGMVEKTGGEYVTTLDVRRTDNWGKQA